MEWATCRYPVQNIGRSIIRIVRLSLHLLLLLPVWIPAVLVIIGRAQSKILTLQLTVQGRIPIRITTRPCSTSVYSRLNIACDLQAGLQALSSNFACSESSCHPSYLRQHSAIWRNVQRVNPSEVDFDNLSETASVPDLLSTRHVMILPLLILHCDAMRFHFLQYKLSFRSHRQSILSSEPVTIY